MLQRTNMGLAAARGNLSLPRTPLIVPLLISPPRARMRYAMILQSLVRPASVAYNFRGFLMVFVPRCRAFGKDVRLQIPRLH